MSEMLLSFCVCTSVWKFFWPIFQLSLLLLQGLVCKDQRSKTNFFAWEFTWVSILYHSKSIASLHYYFLIDKNFPLIFSFMILKNLRGVWRETSFKSSFVKNLFWIQVTLWIHFLFLMNVGFIWYALFSQQALSFYTGRFLNFHLNFPSYYCDIAYLE